MDYFLKLRSWQLFLLLVGTWVATKFVPVPLAFSNNAVNVDLFLVFSWKMGVTLPVVWLWLAWLWAMGVCINQRISAKIKPSAKLFKICVVFFAVYLPSFLLLFLPFMHGFHSLFSLVFPAHLFFMFSFVYMMYFAAKNIAIFEKGTSLNFSDFAGDFVRIWVFPIGVWFIQPRNNLIAREFAASTDNLRR